MSNIRKLAEKMYAQFKYGKGGDPDSTQAYYLPQRRDNPNWESYMSDVIDDSVGYNADPIQLDFVHDVLGQINDSDIDSYDEDDYRDAINQEGPTYYYEAYDWFKADMSAGAAGISSYLSEFGHNGEDGDDLMMKAVWKTQEEIAGQVLHALAENAEQEEQEEIDGSWYTPPYSIAKHFKDARGILIVKPLLQDLNIHETRLLLAGLQLEEPDAIFVVSDDDDNVVYFDEEEIEEDDDDDDSRE